MALDLNDKSGNGNTLTNSGAAEVTTNLPFATSTEAVDLELTDGDYLSAADSATLSITDDITIEAWIKLEQLPSTAGTDFTIVAKWGVTGDKRSYRFYLENTTNKLYFQYSADGTFTNVTILRSINAFTGDDVGVWVHVAAAVDVGARQIVFYKNAVADTGLYISGTDTAIQDNNSSLGIGARLGGNADYFDGIVDEVRVWSDIRTGTEISNNYQVELTGGETNLVAYWPFEAQITTTGGFLALLFDLI